MTVTVPSGDATTLSSPRRRTRRRWIVFASVAALVTALAGLGWWSRHPAEQFVGGYGLRTHVQTGEPLWAALVERREPSSRPVTLTDLQPVFRTDEDLAEVDYLVCDLDDPALRRDGVDGFGAGRGPGIVRRSCTRTVPAEGATFPSLDGPAQALVVRVTPLRPGPVVIARHRISYRDGWQRGEEDVEVHLRIRARR